MAFPKKYSPLAIAVAMIFLFPNVNATCETSDKCPSNSDPLPLKIIAIVAILLSSIIGVGAPFFTRSIKAFNPDGNLFLVIKTFASGIILGTGFMHVLPDSFDMLSSECLSPNPWHNFPFSGFFAMISAIITMIVDAFSTSIYSRKSGIDDMSPDKELEAPPMVGGHSHSHAAHADISKGAQILRYRVVAMVLELGIVVHSVVIGLSLGASNNVCTIRGLVAALCFHQMFEGMGLGGCILQANFTFVKKMLMIFFFSITTPLGIAIGIGLTKVYSEDSPKALITVGLLNACSAGLLIYMALVDLLAVDFMGIRLQGNIKFLSVCSIAVIMGAGCMSLLAKWA